MADLAELAGLGLRGAALAAQVVTAANSVMVELAGQAGGSCPTEKALVGPAVPAVLQT
jgi:hypothetical protein